MNANATGAWWVWLVTYGTYVDVERDGDIKPRLVAGPLSFDAARLAIAESGFGYCMKPWGGE
jgi:hypothetical protein